ncbi:MAG: hypothetical protein KKC03_08340 [Bacteroidetes bacterium]|nr:hypothetical protein [Bacteroidota bacterium]
MKIVLRLLLLFVLSSFGYGFYLRSQADPQAEFFIGLSVLVLCLILMPLFIYHRYKDKDLSALTFKGFEKKENEDI